MNKKSALRQLDVYQLEEEYEQEIHSTPTGRMSSDLRRRGRTLASLGRKREAADFFRQAVALHAPHDHGAAAAAARHDLGHTLSDDPLASGLGLLTAEKLLRAALNSPSRARAPRRFAQTANSLAVCLRGIVLHWKDADKPSRLNEIEQLYRSALRRLEPCGVLGVDQMAEVHLNFANFLGVHRRDYDRALREYDRAISLVRRIERQTRRSMRHVFYRASWAQATLLARRGRRRDLAQAERILVDALKEGDVGYEDRTRIILADVLLGGDSPDRVLRAQTLLTQVRPEHLPKEGEEVLHLATVLVRAQAPDAALERLRDFIGLAIHQRARNTIADFEADTASLDFQAAAALAARIHAKEKQDAVSAFLVLENTSGLRFAEVLADHAWSPSTPLARELQDERLKHVHRTYMLDVIARNLDRLTPDEQQQSLQELLTSPEAVTQELILDELRRAHRQSVPVTHLDSVIQEGVRQVERLTRALQEAEPDFDKVKQALCTDLGPADLLALLREHPDQILLRLDLVDDLLVVGVWLENEQLVARAATLSLPEALRELLHRATEEVKTFREDEQLTALLSQVDLSAALPQGCRRRVVLLPSNSAAQLPLAALGPPGSRPIDRFDSLVWLPCLFPLRTRPAPAPPRTGHVVFIPGKETGFHALALPPSPGQERLEGDLANLEQLRRAAPGARVLSIYTHGEHSPGNPPRLLLPGEQELDLAQVNLLLKGAERVELWACQSGTNRPTDPLTPFVNEGFGLDFLLLHVGVRSAIGTLWSVPDLVTAVLARRFHLGLCEGQDAAKSLAEAQRWWLREGIPELLRHLSEQSSGVEGIVAFAATLGVQLDARAIANFLRTLGPAEDDWSPLRAKLSSPLSWAGIRFTGVPDRAPEKPWTAPDERPLTDEEKQHLERLLAHEPSHATFDEFQDERLTRVTKLMQEASPTPSQAIEMARLLRDRLNSSHQDNLLTALAWVHEALAAPQLAEVDRDRLTVEAAHLWLDVAWGESIVPPEPHPVALARAGKLLETLPPGRDPDADAAHARYEYLRRFSGELELESIEQVRQETLDRFTDALRRATPGSPEALRIATLAVELLATLPEAERGAHANVLKLARRITSATELREAIAAAYQRLKGALAHHEPDEARTARALNFLTPRELHFTVARMVQAEPPRPGSSVLTEVFNQALARLEGDIWGYPTDDGHPLVWTTGTPGEAYRMLLKSYLAGHEQRQSDKAAHLLACLQYACDLRVTFLNRLARHVSWIPRHPDPVFEPLWTLLRIRGLLHTVLADAALLSEEPRAVEGVAPPHRLDPFTHSAQALREGVRGRLDYTAWSLDELCNAREHRPAQVRTAAFEVVLASALLEEEALQRWTALRDAETEATRQHGDEIPLISRGLVSGRELRVNEDSLRELREGEAVLGLSLTPMGPAGELLVMAVWNDGAERGQQVLRIEAGRVLAGLHGLLKPDPVDGGPRRGEAGPRGPGWCLVEEALAPALKTLLRSAQRRRKLRWSLLAPGALRALPLLGLRVGGRPLAAQVDSLAHRPSLDFYPMADSKRAQRKDFTACLLAREQEDGTTCFGEAAVETLRRLRPPEFVVDPREFRGSTVVEVDALERAAPGIRTLRLYGVGGLESLNDTMALLRLEGRRALRERNTHGTLLSRGDVVELWASTAGGADLKRLFRDDTDRIPGLARSFLANGACAVIDLAWPVHDIVKALVCEGYGMARMRMGHSAHALVQAITRAADLLAQLRKQGHHGSVPEVLAALDWLRRDSAHRLFQVDSARLVPFASGAASPAVAHLSGAELVEELSQPVHLGAFRWWGT
ncbi:CHAT domain-containing protein [Pyxidicoccus fallax]|uniref:CHAT domain-containing protein n=1 Tax=Pyxidicoccus fallax TaxID=394095 RepID=A0A848LK99_9BACT|nr:CHAT domain-containing protein [Pyxidicoccus fallax]NMO18123.1 CHAT domain-containing protein [Pyxidicoccus fallax]NPC79417.1 CHAT domain-containing protein [Pyxidicoccus fallax]